MGIQGGLTGALFREFAFALSGAVVISGVVALTLSPMLSSRLLRSGDTERGFAGWVNRRFDGIRRAYVRALSGTLDARASVFVVWAAAALLAAPFYLFSQRELAPNEDQSVVFGIIQAAPNATLDQTKAVRVGGQQGLRVVPGDREHLSDHVPDGGLRRHGHQAVERAKQEHGTASDGVRRGAL